TSEILQNLRFSNLVFLEANHDVDMLVANPDYPEFLKQRILSLKGHLSNDSCAESIADLANYGTKNFVLSHLSTKNNTPQLAFEYISRKLREKNIKEGEDIKIKVASVVPQTIFRL
ncbi:MAG: MBL fold metallo-hydrolase, partial [Clostridia bacterium]|nr:MBL fold metallo-hydrolase [Clostridia bacterium]